MGLLDDPFSGPHGASPWGVLYGPSPGMSESEAEKRAREAAAAGSIDPLSGVSPWGQATTTLPGSPFGPVPDPTRSRDAQAPDFGAGALPFGFEGPGSMRASSSMVTPPPSVFSAGAAPVPFAPNPAAP